MTATARQFPGICFAPPLLFTIFLQILAYAWRCSWVRRCLLELINECAVVVLEFVVCVTLGTSYVMLLCVSDSALELFTRITDFVTVGVTLLLSILCCSGEWTKKNFQSSNLKQVEDDEDEMGVQEIHVPVRMAGEKKKLLLRCQFSLLYRIDRHG